MVSIRWIDTPVAVFFLPLSGRVSALGYIFGNSELIAGALFAALALVRMVRGSLPEYAKVLFVACCAAFFALAANDYGLKPIFGRRDPHLFLGNPAGAVFHIFHGDQSCVFPSGHMAMAAAFVAVLIKVYPRSGPFCVGLLCAGAVALLIGDWHFVSDIVAGAFVGGTAGFIAGELRTQYVRRICDLGH